MGRESDNTIGSKLRELREAHHLKQADLAMAANIKQATYSQYETSKRVPSAIVLYRIANFYGLSVDDLLKLCIDLDDNIFYDAPALSQNGMDEEGFLFFSGLERYAGLGQSEKEVLFHFSKLDADQQRDVIDYAKFKRQQKRTGF